MALELMGENPFNPAAPGGGPSFRIATLFVSARVLITLPGVHATQRFAYTVRLDSERARQGLPPLTEEQKMREWEDAVDLILDGRLVQIRPEAGRMDLAFAADRVLQEAGGISKLHIRFLYANDASVQQAIRARGEYWRIAPPPRTPAEMEQRIAQARIAIGGRPIYYYNAMTGTRYLTLGAFHDLAELGDDELRAHLIEIRDYLGRCNRRGHRELEFFGVRGAPGTDLFRDTRCRDGIGPALRECHRAIEARLRARLPVELRDESPANPAWRNRLFSCLAGTADDTQAGGVLAGVTPEFFLQIRWLPGGRIEQGELIFDSVFDECTAADCAHEVRTLCDNRVKAFVFNYVREFRNVEYVNIGQVNPAVSRRPRTGGDRAYIAEVKHRSAPEPIVRVIRIQKWGIREHLAAGKDLLAAILEAEEYTEFILDRRLGCWQLGMPLPGQIITRRMTEVYDGPATRWHGQRIWTTYFERDFVKGIATDKIPPDRFQDVEFANLFARLLGHAAAPNLVVGRAAPDGQVIFDDGDEVLVLDAGGMPLEIVTADHAGTFTNYEGALEGFLPAYARAVVGRRAILRDEDSFADAYVTGFRESLSHIRDTYLRERRAFDTLFQHGKQDPGAFAWRWHRVLDRLAACDPVAMAAILRGLCRAA